MSSPDQDHSDLLEWNRRIREWVSTVVCIPSPNYGGLPACPYAARAIAGRHYGLTIISSIDDIAELKASYFLPPSSCMIAVLPIELAPSPEEVSAYVDATNSAPFGIWVKPLDPRLYPWCRDDCVLLLMHHQGAMNTAASILQSDSSYYVNFPLSKLVAIARRTHPDLTAKPTHSAPTPALADGTSVHHA